MRASVDTDVCIGCGLCMETCPQVFEQGDDDKSWVRVDDVPPDAEDACREAADGCPVEAISIES